MRTTGNVELETVRALFSAISKVKIALLNVEGKVIDNKEAIDIILNRHPVYTYSKHGDDDLLIIKAPRKEKSECGSNSI